MIDREPASSKNVFMYLEALPKPCCLSFSQHGLMIFRWYPFYPASFLWALCWRSEFKIRKLNHQIQAIALELVGSQSQDDTALGPRRQTLLQEYAGLHRVRWVSLWNKVWKISTDSSNRGLCRAFRCLLNRAVLLSVMLNMKATDVKALPSSASLILRSQRPRPRPDMTRTSRASGRG